MTYTRRDFLKATIGSSAVLSLIPAAPNFLVRSMMAAAHRHNERDTVLVVVQLSGGNDGLNTVVPYEDDEYARNRPTLRLPPTKYIRSTQVWVSIREWEHSCVCTSRDT